MASGIVSSSDSLSWPQGTEFVDSFLKLVSFFSLSMWLSHDAPDFHRSIGDIPLHTLRRLAELDYRKSLVMDRMYLELSGLAFWPVVDIPGIAKSLSCIVFQCIRTNEFDALVPAAFLSVRSKYDYR